MKKTILILGGSSDIGQATIKLFAEKGYDIFATYNRTAMDLDEYCKVHNSKLTKIKLNVRNHGDMQKVISQVFKESDWVESAIYCPGVSKQEKLLIDENDENIEEILDVNLTSAIYFSKEVLKYFYKQKGGSLIFVSSVYGQYGGGCESVYSASKGGLIALTKSLAIECGNFNVRVNCVAPGFIDTKMTKNFNEFEREEVKRRTPLNRLGQPIDVAKTIYFLSDQQSAFITGEVICVAGGAIRY